MKISEAKQMDMVDYLTRLGHHPQYIKGSSYWYTSPLSEMKEKTPSFKVNRKLNRWYEWTQGENRGGNLIDFGVLYHKCGVKELLEKLEGQSSSIVVEQKQVVPESDNIIQVISAYPLSAYPLQAYLKARNIPLPIADQYCQEVRYKLGDKNYYAIGFKNDLGGYELRNKHSKLSSSPKGITFIDNGAKEVAVFEGFFNFLSFQSLPEKNNWPQQNYLILNSTSFFEKNIPLMRQHERANLYLDNDNTGQKFMQLAQAIDKEKFIDQRSLYKGCKDLNAWHIEQSHTYRQRLRQEL
jgi:hypothetical protein